MVVKNEANGSAGKGGGEAAFEQDLVAQQGSWSLTGKGTCAFEQDGVTQQGSLVERVDGADEEQQSSTISSDEPQRFLSKAGAAPQWPSSTEEGRLRNRRG